MRSSEIFSLALQQHKGEHLHNQQEYFTPS